MFDTKVKFFLAAALLFIGVSAANAQLVDGSSIKVSVPTAFVLKDEAFPAGTYTVERTSATNDSPSSLVIRGEGETMIFDTIATQVNDAAAETRLVFETVGNTTYLSAIEVKGETVRSEVPKTKAQRQAVANDVSLQKLITLLNADL